jgi:dihydroflavonol-4-reductase
MIFVTGGSGLVGSHLLFDLTSSGKQVRALIRKNSSIELTRKIFGYYSGNPEKLLSSIEWVEGDVMDIYSLYEAMQDADQVYHAAAMVSFLSSDHKEMLKVNIDGTSNVVNACLYKNVKKLCYVSSIATLGRTDNDDIADEETHWKNSKKNSVY